MSFLRYAEYKDSGVALLGEVPTHWHVTPVRHVANIVNGYPFDSGLFDSSVGMPLVRIRDLNKKATEALYKGERVEAAEITSADVLVGMDGDFNVGRWLGDGVALLNQRMCCVRGQSERVSRLLEYALPAPLRLINDLTYSTTVKHLASSQIEKTKVAIPRDERELEGLLAFLDRETGKIDALIAEQEKLLTLLAEKRQATISHAVTRGLNPNAPMKDSGVPWLGEVPVHWEVVRIKDVAKLESGHTPSKQVPEYWVDCDIPWVSLNDSKQLAAVDYISETAVQINAAGLANSSARLLPADAVVFTRDATIGLAAITTREMAVSQHLIAWCPTGRVEPTYLLRFFNFLKPHLDSLTFGATIKTIGLGEVKKLIMPLPPTIEQLEIVAFLSWEIMRFDELRCSSEHVITLLKERRSALITAAVTGKIDVRGLAELPV